MKTLATACFLAVLTLSTGASAQRVSEIPLDDFERLFAQVKPQPGESPWRKIPWLTDLRSARERAASEGKPLLIFTAADGSPLGRT